MPSSTMMAKKWSAKPNQPQQDGHNVQTKPRQNNGGVFLLHSTHIIGRLDLHNISHCGALFIQHVIKVVLSIDETKKFYSAIGGFFCVCKRITSGCTIAYDASV